MSSEPTRLWRSREPDCSAPLLDSVVHVAPVAPPPRGHGRARTGARSNVSVLLARQLTRCHTIPKSSVRVSVASSCTKPMAMRVRNTLPPGRQVSAPDQDGHAVAVRVAGTLDRGGVAATGVRGRVIDVGHRIDVDAGSDDVEGLVAAVRAGSRELPRCPPSHPVCSGVHASVGVSTPNITVARGRGSAGARSQRPALHGAASHRDRRNPSCPSATCVVS